MRLRYDAVVGFNTKQLWVYDNDLDRFMDPPIKVLNALPDWRDDSGEAERILTELANSDPEWMHDDEYWYSGDTEI